MIKVRAHHIHHFFVDRKSNATQCITFILPQLHNQPQQGTNWD